MIITETLKGAKLLLQILTRYFPPPGKEKHNITLIDDVLEVALIFDDRWFPFRLEDGDCNKTVDNLAIEIVQIMKDKYGYRNG